jgi:HEAT repeat protein
MQRTTDDVDTRVKIARNDSVIAKPDDGTDSGANPVAGDTPTLDNASGPQGVDKLVAVLREAAEKKDHARLKQCLDELVAMGDEAVPALIELMAEGDPQAGVWAAEALSRIGTPLATVSLLDALEQIKESAYKEEVGKRISGISNHESWPILLDAVQDTGDATVLRAAGSALARMADTPIMDEIIARFDASTESADAARLAQIVSNITSSRATEALVALAGDVATPPRDALERAAISALGKIGDPQSVSYLLRKLEASPPGEGAYVFNTITRISQPQAQAALLYAAAGNKEVSADNGRTAAVQALRNYPDERTCQLLESIIAQEENTRVATAAIRALESIRKLSPHVTTTADGLRKAELGFTLPPLKK